MDPETDATQPGVSADQSQAQQQATENPKTDDGEGAGSAPPGERPLSARELAMDAIRVKREDEEERERTGASAQTAPEPAAQPAATAADEADTQLAAQLGEDQVLASGLDKVKVKVKIDGEEQLVSVEEMQRQFQKNGAADKRLAEATRLLQQAQQMASAPPVRVESGAQQNDSAPASQPSGGDVESAKAFVSALFEGDEEKALAALTKVGIGRSEGSTQIDVNQLAQQLTPAIRNQLIAESASEKFRQDYADIVEDPILARIADGFLEAGLKDGTPFPEAMEAAGKLTRQWVASKAPPAPPAPSPTTDRDKKLAMKAGIDEVSAASKTAASTQPAPQTLSDVILEMKKARGLPA